MTQQPEEGRAHLEAARKALADGDFVQARHHITVARLDGMPPPMINQVSNDILIAEHNQFIHREHAVMVAIAVPVVGYAILSLAQPLSWSIPLWAALAFIVVPAIAGAFMAQALPATSKGQFFWRGFSLVSVAMLLYSGINILIAHGRIGSDASAPDVLYVLLLVPIVYALVAGIVGGIASAAMGKMETA